MYTHFDTVSVPISIPGAGAEAGGWAAGGWRLGNWRLEAEAETEAEAEAEAEAKTMAPVNAQRASEARWRI